MDRVIIANGRVVTPWRVLEKGAVVIEGGKIVEVKEGFECGIKVEGFDEIQVGDVLQCFYMAREEAEA